MKTPFSQRTKQFCNIQQSEKFQSLCLLDVLYSYYGNQVHYFVCITFQVKLNKWLFTSALLNAVTKRNYLPYCCVISTLEVRSRWKIPLLWRYWSPRAMSRDRPILTAQDKYISLSSSCSRFPPLMYYSHTNQKVIFIFMFIMWSFRVKLSNIKKNLTSVRAWSCPSWTHTPKNLLKYFKQSAEDNLRLIRHTRFVFVLDLRMLGWQRRFISCTSLSMLALLLASVFIFRAITCPVILCWTWDTQITTSLAYSRFLISRV